MPRVCQITGKKAGKGNSRSHSNIASKRKFNVNLQTKHLLNPATGKYMRLTLSTRAIKTLKKWRETGKKYDLKKLAQY
ncbi:50S ribosomal protein L28 [Candidatus Falkowbacteria bacterium CG10_big_fil_rev_8_21_14_0_10_43_11]|uniref:Large ribosomal subunit protein bL28 n=1 Tax=Candidatus Falkowbacteria bacterium CG10_big_fil_rev_8_21_14_0_10_43_11 TaxID=1974568 RepID=A0A2M6WMD5_9BACT|nr:MAG: 50S ribosomal protein L28 [Candidatus Falkowbacteria bacterium CG10_big_fil_rev_8_21_14_0_10_43_11]